RVPVLFGLLSELLPIWRVLGAQLRSRVAAQGFHKTRAKDLDLPASQLGNPLEVLDRFRLRPRHGLEPLARAQDASLEVESFGDLIAYRLERIHPFVEQRIAIPACRA